MPTSKDLENIADRLMSEYPYSNVPKLFLASGEQAPEGFGLNCVAGIRRWAAEMVELNAKLSYLVGYDFGEDEEGEWEEETNHRAMLVELDGQIFFYDTVIMQAKPIPIAEILKNRGAFGEAGVVYEALPVIDGKPSHVIIRPEGETCFTVTVKTYKRGVYRKMDEYLYDLSKATDFLPEDDDLEIAASIEGQEYFVRFRAGSGRVLFIYDAKSGEFALSKYGDGLRWKTWCSDRPESFIVAARRHLPMDLGRAMRVMKRCPALDEALKKRWKGESSERG